MLTTKWLALGLVVGLGGTALAADPKPVVPPPEPRTVMAGPALVEEIATSLSGIFPTGKEPSSRQMFLLVGELLELHTGKRPTSDELTEMVAEVRPEAVLDSVGDISPVEIFPSLDLSHPVLRMSADQMKELLDSLNGIESEGKRRSIDTMPLIRGGLKDTQPGGFVGGFGWGSDRRGVGNVGGGFNPGGDLKGGFGIPQVRQPLRPLGK